MSMGKLTEEEINSVLSKIKTVHLVMEKIGDKAFMIIGDATIARGDGSCFVLNPPCRYVEMELVNEYVDRVLIRDSFLLEDISRIERLMRTRAKTFENSFVEPVFASHYGFEMPGYEGVFCRNLQDGLGQFEIRYYMQIWKERE